MINHSAQIADAVSEAILLFFNAAYKDHRRYKTSLQFGDVKQAIKTELQPQNWNSLPLTADAFEQHVYRAHVEEQYCSLP